MNPLKAKMSENQNNTDKLYARDQLVVAIDVEAELEIMLSAEQVYRDYLDILKSSVIPYISKNFGLKIREARVLACAEKLDGHVSAADIANTLRQDPATITRSMVSLIGLDFVTTSESFEDGRSRVIILTDKGQKVVTEYNRLLSQAISRSTVIDESYMSADNLSSIRVMFSKFSTRLNKISKRSRTRSKN